jgi:DNA-binding transcriptional LysR family regulator
MDVRRLRYFLAVVDHGSVNKAAAALHVAQPSLSQAIRALERDLGLDLFRRVGVLANTPIRTRDLGGSASTAEFTKAVLAELEN